MTTTAPITDEQFVLEQCDALIAAHPPRETDAKTFLGAQFDRGLAWVHFPEGEGGLGLEPRLQKVVNETLLAAGGPSPYARNPIGHGMGAASTEPDSLQY
jgi:hypothetical protein